MANPEWDNYRPGGAVEDQLLKSEERCARAEARSRVRVLEERCARAEARIVELEGTIAGLRAKMEILIYPENAYKEYKAK